MLIDILFFGLIAGIVAVRNSVIAAMGITGNARNAIVPSFMYSGY